MSSLLSSFSGFVKDFPNCYYVRPLPFSSFVERNWSFIDHISRALPTENTFNLLRSIRSESLIPPSHYPSSAQSFFNVLEVIIKWLEVSYRECNPQFDILQTNNVICYRGLVPSDRATCTLASRANFFVSKKNLR